MGNSARPKKAKGLARDASRSIYTEISGTVPAYSGDDRLVQIDCISELVQLCHIGKSVSGADCLAAIARKFHLNNFTFTY